MNGSPNLLENSYYADILAHRVLFTSDETLNSNSETLTLVNEYASNNTEWLVDFAEAMLKMSMIGVLTGAGRSGAFVAAVNINSELFYPGGDIVRIPNAAGRGNILFKSSQDFEQGLVTQL
ncbi:hypothetical protein AgCh_036875 [Apium graveolens]